MSRQVNMHEAKTHLSRLVDEAAAGEEIVIARNGKPAARLIKVQERPAKRPGYGALRGEITMPSWEEWKAMDREIEDDFFTDSPDDPLFWPPDRTR
jgi:prevent-host-death family protein